jgi:hypothetical protein
MIVVKMLQTLRWMHNTATAHARAHDLALKTFATIEIGSEASID